MGHSEFQLIYYNKFQFIYSVYLLNAYYIPGTLISIGEQMES